MLKNYFLVAIRNLLKSKIFSLINIVGLALGMACSLLILLWITDERNMNKFNKNSSRLYSVYERQYFDNKVDAFHATPGACEATCVLSELRMNKKFRINI